MALRPDTPETRMVPVAGRQFAKRRLIRGVGAKERAVGNAWSRLNSRQRQYYGNQRNFAGRMQEVANRRAIQAEQDREEMLRAKGRAMANNGNGNAQPTNHAATTIKPETERFIQNEVDKDMHPEGKPKPKSAEDALYDAAKEGRVRDISLYGSNYDDYSDKEKDAYWNRGADGAYDKYINDPSISPGLRRDYKHDRMLTKGYQMHSLAQARLRGQFNRNPALVADSRRI